MKLSISAITLSFLFFTTTVQGVLLYVASWSRNITVLSLTYEYFASTGSPAFVEDGYFAGFAPQKKYQLSMVDTFATPAQLPAWLTLNKHNDILYLVDGVTTGNGTLTAYRTSSHNGTGPPVQLDSVECLLDGAYAGFYANGRGLAVAHYTSSALQTYDVSDTVTGKLKPVQTFTYTMGQPGPAPSGRQTAPHIHEARTDPLGQYMLAVDLGADKVRVYAIDDETLRLDERSALNATAGSGPRHGVFTAEPVRFPDGNASYVYYLAAEIAGTITAYRVHYLPKRGGLRFDYLHTYSSLEPGVPKPATGGKGVTAELRLSPDGDFLIVSNRRDARFNGTATQYPPNGTSDSISTFRVRSDLAGRLDFVQAVPAGGSLARTYDLNRAGNLAAVGVQDGFRVAILERDLGSGLFKEQVAEIDVPGQIWGVVWNE
ncbi:putative isomerase YbhE [Aspergillus violaceofuscus CBS 115571]|uniref:Putative isomerase YbhE n=1 Tax=Aspergillus violaceofuscus (strain CBS 115571) TaxID=1450538 RepID=A0A2V5HDN1_ASPV1|nr:putative isomerase YbhE [Aspergillus violaceofuscus CBS 115571]